MSRFHRKRKRGEGETILTVCPICNDCIDPKARNSIRIRTFQKTNAYCVECILYTIESCLDPRDPITRARYSKSQIARIRNKAKKLGHAVIEPKLLRALLEVEKAYKGVETLCSHYSLKDLEKKALEGKLSALEYLQCNPRKESLGLRIRKCKDIVTANVDKLNVEGLSLINWTENGDLTTDDDDEGFGGVDQAGFESGFVVLA